MITQKKTLNSLLPLKKANFCNMSNPHGSPKILNVLITMVAKGSWWVSMIPYESLSNTDSFLWIPMNPLGSLWITKISKLKFSKSFLILKERMFNGYIHCVKVMYRSTERVNSGNENTLDSGNMLSPLDWWMPFEIVNLSFFLNIPR